MRDVPSPVVAAPWALRCPGVRMQRVQDPRMKYLKCDCCDEDAEYKHWSAPTESYWWFCEKDKCDDCEFMGWQKA